MLCGAENCFSKIFHFHWESYFVSPENHEGGEMKCWQQNCAGEYFSMMMMMMAMNDDGVESGENILVLVRKTTG
jgi:hypothetical protein